MHCLHLKKKQQTPYNLKFLVTHLERFVTTNTISGPYIMVLTYKLNTSTISNALQLILLQKRAAYQLKIMYTNGNDGNNFDQYTISYTFLCIIIIIMQEVLHYFPSVYFYLNYFSQKGHSVLAGCCCGHS